MRIYNYEIAETCNEVVGIYKLSHASCRMKRTGYSVERGGTYGTV